MDLECQVFLASSHRRILALQYHRLHHLLLIQHHTCLRTVARTVARGPTLDTSVDLLTEPPVVFPLVLVVVVAPHLVVAVAADLMVGPMVEALLLDRLVVDTRQDHLVPLVVVPLDHQVLDPQDLLVDVAAAVVVVLHTIRSPICRTTQNYSP